MGARVITDRGKGGHVLVLLDGRRAFVPTGSGEVKHGTLMGILRQLGLRLEDMR
jgi:predicted RNA binding protein YcfA (HicA-like mRNA interferase family)